MYNEEKAIASKFLYKCEPTTELKDTIEEIKKPFYSHSERWSMVFDMIFANYPFLGEERGKIVTGIVYLVEDEEI